MTRIKPRLVSTKTIERLFKYSTVEKMEYILDDETNVSWKVFHVCINNKAMAVYKLPAFAELREGNIERLYQVLKGKWEEKKNEDQ